jgi:phosphoribosylformimino-5-aminoimidazole carboxamide ribotide isomerase
MDLLPALDLRHGRTVRLRQGDAGQATIYDQAPESRLAAFAAAGVRWVHVVDLDAALGEPPQRELLARLEALAAAASGSAVPAGSDAAPSREDPPPAAAAASWAAASSPGGNPPTAAAAAPPRFGLALQLGGGMRDQEAIEWALAAGFERVVVGSLLARDAAAFRRLAVEHPGRLVPALDLAAGQVRVAGWREAAKRSPEELCAELAGLPCPAVLVTDVARDGMLAGPNLELALRMARAAALPALLSGGVRSLSDLEAARQAPEIAGVIVGRALYEGAFSLAAALAAAAGEGAAGLLRSGEGAAEFLPAGDGAAGLARAPGEGAAGLPRPPKEGAP